MVEKEIERIYTVPLRDAYRFPRSKRALKAKNIVRSFLARHMKVTEDHVMLSETVNSILWQRGIQKPPRKLKIKVAKEGDKVVARLIDEKVEKRKEEKPKEKKKEKPKEIKPEEKPEEKAEEKTEEEKIQEEKKKEIEKEIRREQRIAAKPRKDMIKDLRK